MPSRARANACATPVPGGRRNDVARAQRVLLGRCVAARPTARAGRRPRAPRTAPPPVNGSAPGRPARGGEHHVVEARRHRAGGLAGAARATIEDRRHVVERDHVAAGARPRRRTLGCAGGRLARERGVAVAELHPTRERPCHAGARERRERGVAPLSEHEHVETAGARAERVRTAFGPMHDQSPSPTAYVSPSCHSSPSPPSTKKISSSPPCSCAGVEK